MTDQADADITPDATISAAPDAGDPTSAACIVTNKYDKWRVTWDPTQRLKSQLASDAANSPVRLAWHYDLAGRLLSYTGFGPDPFDNFQEDSKYDDHGNLEDYRLSYPSKPDPSKPSTADPWWGSAYANEYDPAGRLVTSAMTSYGAGNQEAPRRMTFVEDGKGRCQRIETLVSDNNAPTSIIETRSYDDADRLHTVEMQYETGGTASCASTVTYYEYDGAGRISSSRTTAAPNSSCSDSGGELPRSTQSFAYGADGSVRIESFDYTSDVADEMIVIDGKQVWVLHDVETRTPDCARIEAEIAADVDLSCHIR